MRAGSGAPGHVGARQFAVASLVAFVTLLSGCSNGEAVPRVSPVPSEPTGSPEAFPVTLTDDDGVAVTLDRAPTRIVTWAPSNTEILFALGLGERIVGVSGPFDDHPPEAAGIESVAGAGGVEPNVEKVVALEPDVVLNGFLGGDQWKARLRELGVHVFSIYAADFEDALADIRTVGTLTGATRNAAALVQDMEARATDIEEQVAGEPPVSCFLEVGYPDLYTVGPQDFPFEMLERAGCDPVTEEADGPYPVWSLERLVEDDPEVYLVTTEAGVTPEDVAERPGFGSLAAVEAGRVHVIDSDLITRPGPRLVAGLESLARALHPGVLE